MCGVVTKIQYAQLIYSRQTFPFWDYKINKRGGGNQELLDMPKVKMQVSFFNISQII